MCGISFTCSKKGPVSPDHETESALRARGPDSLKYHHLCVQPLRSNKIGNPAADVEFHLGFGSSVLSLRGDHICVQPLIDQKTESVLCWNGEAWKVDGVEVTGNDTEHVFRLLLDATSTLSNEHEASPSDVAKVLTRVTGPYAFVFYDARTSTVYYGRDRLGRRSLVVNGSDLSQDDLTISSISFDKQPANEVSADGIHYIDLRSSSPSVQHLPWPTESPLINSTEPDVDQSIASIPSMEAVTTLQWHLSESIRLRVVDVPTYTTNVASLEETPSRVAILFSGGLDCTLLARIVHDVLPKHEPIDLLNVAFENPRTVRAATQSGTSSSTSPYEGCPDRITARLSYAELTTACPSRTWRFVAIDVPYSETLTHRPKVIKLMSPHNTEMDLSITLALYFASRGQGRAITSPTSTSNPYTTTSRVLLSGLGADELFGGYARHAAAFTRTSYSGLNAELALDFSRIGTRNLGRDDRVMAHWGREIRYPYLDEDFVAFALSMPAWEKTGFRPGRAVPKHFEGAGRVVVENEEELDPAKMVLRLMTWKLGMRGVAGEKKRAIQFGARTAKMEGGRTKGTDVLGVAVDGDR